MRLSELGRSKVGGKTTGESQEVGQRRVEDPIRWMDDVFKLLQTSSNNKRLIGSKKVQSQTATCYYCL